MVPEFPQKQLTVLQDGKEAGRISASDALAQLQEFPQHRRILRDPASGKFVLVVFA